MSRYLDWCIEQEGFRAAEEMMLDLQPRPLSETIAELDVKDTINQIKNLPRRKKP